MSYAQEPTQLVNRMVLQATKSTTSKIASMRNDGSPSTAVSRSHVALRHGIRILIFGQDEEAFMGFEVNYKPYLCVVF